MRTRLMKAPATALVLALVLAACGGGDDGGADNGGASPTPDGGMAAAEVSVVDIAYEPDALTVKVGTRVTWTNTGQQPHSVTAKDGTFDSSPGCSASDPGKCLGNGDTFEFTFTSAGTFKYFCSFHGESLQSGTITVEA